MGADKKIGISKEYRSTAKRYCNRYSLYDYSLELSRSSGRRVIYLIAEDEDGVIYRIRFDKVMKMRRPRGVQVINKLHYFLIQANKVHGDGTYDYSMIKEEDITFSNKLDIICETHGVFKKRKSAHVTDMGGCPKCAKKRFNSRRKYHNG